jgi:hypothetical protein
MSGLGWCVRCVRAAALPQQRLLTRVPICCSPPTHPANSRRVQRELDEREQCQQGSVGQQDHGHSAVLRVSSRRPACGLLLLLCVLRPATPPLRGELLQHRCCVLVAWWRAPPCNGPSSKQPTRIMLPAAASPAGCRRRRRQRHRAGGQPAARALSSARAAATQALPGP